MIKTNPYESPLTPAVADPGQRRWKGGADSVLVIRRLLQRKVIVSNPVDVTIEYFARGLRDRIIVDGITVVSIIPIVWLHERFDFDIPYCDGKLPATVMLQLGRFLRIERFQIHINGVVAYYEENGQQIVVAKRCAQTSHNVKSGDKMPKEHWSTFRMDELRTNL